ncbi:MAG TPA: hypothetical protein ENN72_06735 [Firmicutes bacterium]|nr:hypothetical protein [Bacillota bacterium]
MGMKTDVLIVTAQQRTGLHLQKSLRLVPGLSIKGPVHSSHKLLFFLTEYSPVLALIFLCPVTEKWLRLLFHAPRYPQVIFTASHSSYAPLAYTYNCAGYLVEPYSERDLCHTVKKALIRGRIWEHAREADTESLFPLSGKQKNHTRFFHPGEIDYFKAEDKYVFIFSGKKRYFCPYSLKELEGILKRDDFCRIRRNLIISRHAVHNAVKESPRDIYISLRTFGKPVLKVGRFYIPRTRKWLGL